MVCVCGGVWGGVGRWRTTMATPAARTRSVFGKIWSPELRMMRWLTAVLFVDIAAPVPRRTAATTWQPHLLLPPRASVIATASTVSRPMMPARSTVLLGALTPMAPRPEQTAASRRSCTPINGCGEVCGGFLKKPCNALAGFRFCWDANQWQSERLSLVGNGRGSHCHKRRRAPAGPHGM